MHLIPQEMYVIFVTSNTLTNEGLECTLNQPTYMGNFCKFEHPDKWKFWSAVNWARDVGNSCKLEHSHKLRFCSVLNWPINVGNSCNLEQ